MTRQFSYYNYSKLDSFNATFNFVVGARGLGKTWGAKRKVIAKGIKTGEQFIYVRRYKNELATAARTFVADIANEFPDHHFRMNGSLFQFATAESFEEKKDRKWITIGFFIALSTSQMQKSVAFPNVKTIIYDEFIIERGALHYLPDEVTIFTNFYSTVDRYQDKTRVYFLANSVSIMNPYFIDYDIVPNPDKEFVGKSDGFIMAHFPNADDFTSEVYETRFGKFIKDSDYSQYAVGNTFSDNNDAMLAIKDPKARYQFTLECHNGSFSVWYNMFENEYFVQSKLPKVEEIFTLLPEKMDTHKRLMTFSDRPLSMLRTAFRQGSISFDKPATRNTFAEIFKR